MFPGGLLLWKRDRECFSVIFQSSEYAPNHVALIPTQLYSSGLDFLHFLLLLLIARNKKEDGQVTACYLIFYSIGRFVIEFSVGILSVEVWEFCRLPSLSVFYRDCGDRAADTDQEKKTARAAFKRIREVPCIRKKLDNSGIRTGFRCIHL